MRRRFVGFEPLEQRCLLSATVFENHDIGYFLNQSNHRLERYDIAHEAWLTPINISGASSTPTAALVDDDGIYVAYDTDVYHYNLDGSGQTHLVDVSNPVNAIHSDGNLLFVNYSGGFNTRFKSIDKTTNTVLATIDYYGTSVYDSDIAPGVNRIFGHRQSVSSEEISYIAYSDDGTFAGNGSTPYHGNLSRGFKSWAFPDSEKIVEDSGTIYSTSGLTWWKSLGSKIDDMDFLETNEPIILKGSMLTAYSQDMLPKSSITLAYKPSEIFVNVSDVITFTADPLSSTGFRADIVPLSQFASPIPGQLVDPNGLAFTPNNVELAADGTVLIFSNSQQSIFRWNPDTQAYTQSIPLMRDVKFMAYSAETNTAYLAYESGLIRKLDLRVANPVEVPYAVLPSTPLGLATAGSYVFANDNSGAWCSHYTFDPDGGLIDRVDLNYYSKEFMWSAANQKMYFLRDSMSPNDLLWEEINADGTTYSSEPAGGIRGEKDSPLHDSDGFTHPVRVAPDGSVVVLGSGVIHDATTLERLPATLANSIDDAAWLGGELITARNVAGWTQFQHWAKTGYKLVDAFLMRGTVNSLIALSDDLLLSITIDDRGIPVYTTINRNLEGFSIPPDFSVKETLDGTSVYERGTSDTLVVALKAKPASDVVIKVTNSDTDEVVVSPASLTFTPDNWNLPQLVTVTGVDDDMWDGAQKTLVRFSVNIALSDNAFRVAADKDIDVFTIDDEIFAPRVCEHNGVGYFFAKDASRIDRYDIAHATWLNPILLAGATNAPTTGHIDDDGIYVAYGMDVYRYNLDGTKPIRLIHTLNQAIAIHSDGNLLFVNYSSGYRACIVSLDKTTNTVIDKIENSSIYPAIYGSTIAPIENRILGRSGGISPSDIEYIAYNDDGTFCIGGDSPYHGVLPGASRTWMFPGAVKVVDDSGTIYSTSDLTRLNSFGSSITDIGFLGGDVPIILQGNTLTAYTQGILPTGSVTLSYTPANIFVNSANIITFTPDETLPTGFRVDAVPLSQLKAPLPGKPVDPTGLPFTPDKVEVTVDGIILLFSKAHQSIFRWDPATQRYGDTIPLIGIPDYMDYSAANNTAYLLYPSGLIRKIDFNAPQPVETPFAILPGRPLGISAADQYVFAVANSGPYCFTHYTFAPDGAVVDSVTQNFDSKEYVWNAANQKMYFFRDNISPNDLLWEEINANGKAYPNEPQGGIGREIDSPLHELEGFSHPVRVAPDGSVVVLGSGRIHNAMTLDRLSVSLANTIDDATWLDGELITARNLSGKTEIQHWLKSNYGLYNTLQLPGTVNSLITVGDLLLAITINSQGMPVYTLIDKSLSIVSAEDKSFFMQGSAANDSFVFRAGNDLVNSTLTINGVSQTIPANVTNIVLDGFGGSDELSFYGSINAVIADLYYARGTFRFGRYTLGFTNMDYVTVSGSSNIDRATLHDSIGADAFQGLPDFAQLTTTGKALTVKKFLSVNAQSTLGNDTALMFDSQMGGSRFIAGTAGVNYAGGGFNYTLSSFKSVSAYSKPGGNGTAVFNSTDGHDLLIASYLGAQYIGQSFSYDVWNVPSITGNAGAGDEARFYGSPGANTNLTVSAVQAVQSEPSFTLTGNNYGKFSSYVYPDGNTTATIVGTAAADRAVTSPLGSQLFSTDVAISAWTYKHINLQGNGGNDTADMYGSGGADSFTGNGPAATMTTGGVNRTISNFAGQVTAHGNAASTATFFAKQGMTNTFDAGAKQAAMSGPGYNNVAQGFGSCTGYAIPGGSDVANYADSSGTDYFISSYLGTQMFGPGYSNAAWSFATMNATSTAGADTARFYGSPTSADHFVAAPGDAKQSGQGYQSEAKNFARVEAFAGLGTGGTAGLTGSSSDDSYVGSPLGAQLWNSSYRLEAWNFASVKTEGNGGNDVANMYGGAANNQLAADNVFAQFSGNGFANRVEHFATTAIHGSTTGTDSGVLDHAYLETGVKETPNNDQGHTIDRKLWLYDFDQISTTEKPTQTTPQPQLVDQWMTAFMFK